MQKRNQENTTIEAIDAPGSQKLFQFLIKSQTMGDGNWVNPLVAPKIVCMIRSRLSVQPEDRQNRNISSLERNCARQQKLMIIQGIIFKDCRNLIHSGDATKIEQINDHNIQKENEKKNRLP